MAEKRRDAPANRMLMSKMGEQEADHEVEEEGGGGGGKRRTVMVKQRTERKLWARGRLEVTKKQKTYEGD